MGGRYERFLFETAHLRGSRPRRSYEMRKLFKYGGIIASIALIVAGTVSIGAGALGVIQVRDALSGEKIVGSPDT